jgi:hypothetical protein
MDNSGAVTIIIPRAFKERGRFRYAGSLLCAQNEPVRAIVPPTTVPSRAPRRDAAVCSSICFVVKLICASSLHKYFCSFEPILLYLHCRVAEIGSERILYTSTTRIDSRFIPNNTNSLGTFTNSIYCAMLYLEYAIWSRKVFTHQLRQFRNGPR